MDPVFGDIIGSRIYKKCFAKVFGSNLVTNSDQNDAELDKCMLSYIASYQIVSKSFTQYVTTLPKKGLNLQ